MKPETQLFRHEPEKDIWGDCYRTAIACLLEIVPERVPHVYHRGKAGPGMAGMRHWLAERGLGIVEIPFTGSLEDILQTFGTLNPRTYYLLTGKSRNGVCHVVVCCDNEIVHDPSIDQSGIVGPTDEGFFHIEVLVPAIVLNKQVSK